MDVIIAPVPWPFALVYLHDILVFSKLSAGRIEQDRRVLRLLHEAGVTLKLKNYKLFTATTGYLGHFIRPGRLEVEERTTDSVAK